MKTDRECIIELVRILARPHTLLMCHFFAKGSIWDGIRLEGDGYELFYTEYPSERIKKLHPDVEEMETIIPHYMLNRREEMEIKETLEEILINC